MNIGLIFATWDETIGPETIAVFPDNFIEDPDLIAIQYFSSSQFIFGGEEFIKISFVMPLVYLQLDAILFFDYIIDDKVRGGKSPILLILMFEQCVPRSIINQYNNKIEDMIEKIKPHYKDCSIVKDLIKEMHKLIIDDLSGLNPTAFDALKDSESRFKALFEDASDPIFVFELDSRIVVDLNLKAEAMLKKPRNEIIGMKGKALFIPDDIEKLNDLIEEHLSNKNAPPIITNVITSDAKKIPVEINANIIEIAGKKLIEATFRDITKRREAEILAKTMKLYAESIVETIRQPVIVLDSEFNVLSANFSFCEIFKQLPQDIENKSIYSIGKGQWNIPEIKSLLEDILSHQSEIDEYEINHEFSGRVGQKRLLIDASKVENTEDQSEIIIIAIEDITHR